MSVWKQVNPTTKDGRNFLSNPDNPNILSARSFLGEHSSLILLPTFRQASYPDILHSSSSTPNKEPDKADHLSDSTPQSKMSTRLHIRSAGLPRLDAGKPATLSDDRRRQVRHAQRTYRLKKEAALRSTQARIEELEGGIRRAAVKLDELNRVAMQAELHVSHPHINAMVKSISVTLNERDGSDSLSPVPVSTKEDFHESEMEHYGLQHIFGYQPARESEESITRTENPKLEGVKNHTPPPPRSINPNSIGTACKKSDSTAAYSASASSTPSTSSPTHAPILTRSTASSV